MYCSDHNVFFAGARVRVLITSTKLTDSQRDFIGSFLADTFEEADAKRNSGHDGGSAWSLCHNAYSDLVWGWQDPTLRYVKPDASFDKAAAELPEFSMWIYDEVNGPELIEGYAEVAYHAAYGGFTLTEEVVKWLAERDQPQAVRAIEAGHATSYGLEYAGSVCVRATEDAIPRHDPLLIDAIRHFAAHDDAIRIKTLKSGRYVISEYDGWEHVIEPEDVKWVDVPGLWHGPSASK